MPDNLFCNRSRAPPFATRGTLTMGWINRTFNFVVLWSKAKHVFAGWDRKSCRVRAGAGNKIFWSGGGNGAAGPKTLRGPNLLTLNEQQYFVWDTGSQNTKWQDMLEILTGCTPGYAYGRGVKRTRARTGNLFRVSAGAGLNFASAVWEGTKLFDLPQVSSFSWGYSCRNDRFCCIVCLAKILLHEQG